MKKIFISLCLLFFIGCDSKDLLHDFLRSRVKRHGSFVSDPTCGFAAAHHFVFYKVPGVKSFMLPFGSGHYKVDPKYEKCLDCDKSTGKIFATSVAGIYYPITFTNDKETKYACVLISGMRYPESIFYLRQPRNVITPYYNANSELPAPQGSRFDTPPDGERSAASQGVAIDHATGAIDVDKTFSNGIFGDVPVDGDTKNFRIYYMLNDQSQFGLNYTDITFVFRSQPGAQRSAAMLRTADADPRCTTTVVVVK